MRRNSPLICFPCCEIVASASNLLMTVSGSISMPSLSDSGKPGKLLPFPSAASVSWGLLSTYPVAGTAGTVCQSHYRLTLGITEAP